MKLRLLLTTQRWLVLVLGLAFFYFYSGGGPNQGSRFNLDRAILEHQELRIDWYHNNSEDKAFYRGHYYSDKAPGTSFAALPALYVTRVLMKFTSVDPNSTQAFAAQFHVATWAAATLPALLMCITLFNWTRRKGYSTGTAVYACLAAGLASPMWVYATIFWGNALAACLLVLAASCVDRLTCLGKLHNAIPLALVSGFSSGAAVLVEYPAAPLAATLALLLIIKLRPWRDYLPRLAAFGIAVLFTVVLLGVYNRAAFGTPFHLGYSDVQGFDAMKRGVFGVTIPSWGAISGVIWGPRGFLITAPLLALGFAGHVLSIVQRRHRTLAIVCLIFSTYPILLNVSYAYWDGGWTYGPRHMSNAFPFLALGLAPLFHAASKHLRVVLVLALAGASLVSLMGVSVHGMTPYTPPHPFSELYWPSFWSGRFARHTSWEQTGGPNTNLGLALGLSTRLSLVPFGCGVAIGLIGLVRSLKRPAPKRSYT